MSESAGRVVAWQVRSKRRGSWSVWTDIDQETFDGKFCLEDDGGMGIPTEYRALVPEQLLVEAESLVAMWKHQSAEHALAHVETMKALAAVRALADELIDGLGARRDCERETVGAHDATVDICEQLRALTQTPTEAVKK